MNQTDLVNPLHELVVQVNHGVLLTGLPTGVHFAGRAAFGRTRTSRRQGLAAEISRFRHSEAFDITKATGSAGERRRHIQSRASPAFMVDKDHP